MTRKHVSVTGAGGYLGSVLVGKLLGAGYSVTAIDRYFFGIETLDLYSNNPNLRVLAKDTRELTPRDLEGSWAVIDLAALSNDPSGDLDPELTVSINQTGRMGVARAARSAGVERFVMSSSCSVYGAGAADNLTEDSPLNPLTQYAKSCAAAEELVRGINGPGFTAGALRLSTLFGLSPRMRFDLVVNTMTFDAFNKGRILINGGQQWRPLLGVSDAARGFINAIEAPASVFGGNAFNLGLGNLRIVDVAAIVRDNVPGSPELTVTPSGADARDYNVSFERAKTIGFVARQKLAESIRDIAVGLEEWRIRTDDRTRTVVWYQHLLAQGGGPKVLPPAMATPVLAPPLGMEPALR